MGKIRMLSEDLIGKIAAGEVVERPSAAIKELVENSLDAGARSVTVEIQDGGTTSFRVTDDGSGIDESDLRMAFERHATSKIRSEKDLDAIGTLGFRGEALASIAAVGKIILTTRTRDRETGLRVLNDGGLITSIKEVACAPGTSILVKDLFYNVPVRRGFLKKPNSEAGAITDLMTRLILSRPDVSFRYLSGGKQIYQSPGDGKTESAVLSIYGVHAMKSMRWVDGHCNGIVIRGYIGIGENARSNRSGENFFINGRIMRSALLSGCLEDACRERVMIGKYPICSLYLTMPYESVNVNVHPNKLEVRFRDDYAVREAVLLIVQETLQDRDAFQRPVEMDLVVRCEEKSDSEISAGFPEKKNALQNGILVEKGGDIPAIKMAEKPMPVYMPVSEKKKTISEAFRESEVPPATRIRVGNERKQELAKGTDSSAEFVFEQKNGSDGPKDEKSHEEKDSSMIHSEQMSVLPPDLPKPIKIFGAVFNTFILIEYEDHLLMVDQHAVHERILYDKMMKACEEHRAGQEMLVPSIIGVTKREMQTLEENRDLLTNLGLIVEPFGEYEVAVRSVPIILGQNETAEFLRDAINELENGRVPGAEKKRAAILQQACKHAVKGGESLPDNLLRSLVEEMIDRKVTPTCPHGRPLVVSISHTELDKKFKRIQ